MADRGTSNRNYQGTTMSKQRPLPTTSTPPAKPMILPESVAVNVVWVPPVNAVDETGHPIEQWKKCPVCWTGNGGYGLVRSTQGNTRYVMCKKSINPEAGPCGHTWTAKVYLETIVVEHRVVTLDGER